MVDQIVTQHGGEVTIDNRPELGVQVTLRLPRRTDLESGDTVRLAS